MRIFRKKQKDKTPQKSWRRAGVAATSSSAGGRGRKTSRKFSRFLFWLLFFGFFGICTYLAFFSPFLEIESVSVEGNQDIPGAEIVSRVENSLGGKYFGIAPKSNFFLASKRNISGAVHGGFDRLEVASIEKKFPKKILVRVIERKAKLVWCSGGVCYFVANDGLAYGGANGTEEEFRAKNFLVVIDDSAIPAEMGKTKIDPAFVAFAEEIGGMVRDDLDLGISESFHTPGIASREISVRTGEGWILKLSSEYPAEESKKIVQALFEKELNGEARKNLEYLDLRVKGKIYYKLKVKS